jgi:hypothetical protein
MKMKLVSGAITLVIVLGIGGYWYFEKTTRIRPTALLQEPSTALLQETSTALAPTTQSKRPDWKTYVNAYHGYMINYLSTAKISFITARGDIVSSESITSSTTERYVSNVVRLDDASQTWFLQISSDDNIKFCRSALQKELLSASKRADTFNIKGQQISAYTSGPEVFQFCLGSSNPLVINYGAGTDGSDITQKSLDLMHSILSTLTFIPN